MFVQLHLRFLGAGTIRGPTAGCAKPLFSSRIPRDFQVSGHLQIFALRKGRRAMAASGYGKPAVLAFHSGACSGCGSVLAPFGTWMGRGEAVQRVVTGKFSSPESASSDRRGATTPRASTSSFTLENSVSFSLRIFVPNQSGGNRLAPELLPEVSGNEPLNFPPMDAHSTGCCHVDFDSSGSLCRTHLGIMSRRVPRHLQRCCPSTADSEAVELACPIAAVGLNADGSRQILGEIWFKPAVPSSAPPLAKAAFLRKRRRLETSCMGVC